MKPIRNTALEFLNLKSRPTKYFNLKKACKEYSNKY